MPCLANSASCCLYILQYSTNANTNTYTYAAFNGLTRFLGTSTVYFAQTGFAKQAFFLDPAGTEVCVSNITQDAAWDVRIDWLIKDFATNNTAAEIVLHPNGRFLYGSNRGHDSIAVFAVDTATGRLALVEHASTLGRTPRHFALDPSGRWLLAENQGSDSVVVFAVDGDTGKLKPTGQVQPLVSPTCAVFVNEK